MYIFDILKPGTNCNSCIRSALESPLLIIPGRKTRLKIPRGFAVHVGRRNLTNYHVETLSKSVHKRYLINSCCGQQLAGPRDPLGEEGQGPLLGGDDGRHDV